MELQACSYDAHKQSSGGTVAAAVAVEVKEDLVDVPFTVVRWSSQSPECPARDLNRSEARCWKSAPSNVKDQYLVFECGLHPCTITGIRLVLPGTDANPRQCAVQYSKACADGPWTDAWEFEVRPERCEEFRSLHNFGAAKKEFKDLLTAQCGGCIEAAWRTFLDVNGDGKLSYPEFISACDNLRLSLGAQKRWAWAEDLRRLFKELDSDGKDGITLSDITRDVSGRPEAVWWRVVFQTNMGSAKDVQVLSPLRLLSDDPSFGAPTSPRLDGLGRSGHFGRNRAFGASHEPEEDLALAFDVDRLELTEAQKTLRGLASRQHIPWPVVEDIHRQFCRFDVDGSGSIDEGEFNDLILKLHGSEPGSGQVPNGRLRFFWQEADRERNGLVDFEAFLKWFYRYFYNADMAFVSLRTGSTNLATSFYAQIVARRAKELPPMTPARQGRPQVSWGKDEKASGR